jgi:hypothetical protein
MNKSSFRNFKNIINKRIIVGKKSRGFIKLRTLIGNFTLQQTWSDFELTFIDEFKLVYTSKQKLITNQITLLFSTSNEFLQMSSKK